MASSAKKTQPWYKQKHPISKYKVKGDPIEINTSSDIPNLIPGWVPPNEEEVKLWEDAKCVVFSKNKKREFRLSPDKEEDVYPLRNKQGLFSLRIEVLHVDYQGFIYSDVAASAEELNKLFWPNAVKLIAHYTSPKIKGKLPLYRTSKV